MPIYLNGGVKEEFTITLVGATAAVKLNTTPLHTFSLFVKATGLISTWSLDLEGSINDTDFTPIMRHTNLIKTGITVFSGVNRAPCLSFRINCTEITLGLGTNLLVTVLGTR